MRQNQCLEFIAELIENCDVKSESVFLDLPVICADGIIYWSQFLLASVSEKMKAVLAENQDFCVMIPDLESDFVFSTLKNFVNINENEISKEESFLLNLFGIDKKREEKSEEINKDFKCNFPGCNAEFQRLRHFQRHQASHKKETRYVCDQCGKVFFHEDSLKLHIRYHKDLQKIHTCPHCHYDFQGKRALQSHIDDHHAPQVPCPICQKTLKKRLLLRHIRSKHSEDNTKLSLKKTLENLKLNIPKKKAKKKSKIEDNEKDAVEELIESQEKRVHCANCDKTFSNQYIAKYHNEKVHLKVARGTAKELSCSVCEKKFVGPSSRLARHMREVHAENRFECSECGHFFPVKASLERHLMTVHHPRKQECPYCPVQVVHITAHLTSAHGLSSVEARHLASEISGKSAARTNLPFDS